MNDSDPLKDANSLKDAGSLKDADSLKATAHERQNPATGAAPGAAPDNAAVVLPRLGFFGTLRWAWRQLTSMRTALFLLLLLAVGAVPGSLFPQRPADPAVVTKYLQDHPDTGPVLDWFKLFDVYSSPWFSAIYILLFISLIGCVVPRAIAHYKAMRSQPPRTPRRLSRLPEYGTLEIPAARGIPAGEAIRDAAAALKSRGYRLEIRDADGDRPSVGAERGFTKEVGNLLFHTALIGVLVSVALGGLFGYSGQRVLVEGDTFVNTLVGYDTFTPGSNFDAAQLEPYSIQLDKFEVKFDRESKSHYGQPLDFKATLTTKSSPSSSAQQQDLKVNSPVNLGGTSIYLVGNGYAPVVTVKDGDGKVAFQGPVVSVPSDGAYTSLLVVKAPDAKPSQLGFVGFFLPTALINDKGVAVASDPDPFNPQLNLNSYFGDLGLDAGQPKNVFTLDTSKLTQLNGRDLKAGGIVLSPGASYTLPEGKGSVSFDGIKRYVALDIHHNPGQGWALIFGVTALLGLVGSLFLNRRRVWIRTGNHADGRTMVEYGLLARGEDHRLAAEATAIRALLEKRWLAPGAEQAEDSNGAQSSTGRTSTGSATVSKDQ
ncbi:cytochrome c biogenesis protein ResB [Paenarthrobacter sp. PH39-S1]|uniref:cytochrome c biogenesis protein ResB n=1 Tax=Paenarthrobacter sp. PH39-S1 TaxID=3046204 RepID=UPI0024BB4F61|nr:cytochrome c biogenesis protein ResB [Paenarthrobacter sp. PH39-S1]MDJ0355129.1 cytochrome c biogenesis protein ResB [Paenarthrobacter sp. PH39-S1]